MANCDCPTASSLTANFSPSICGVSSILLTKQTGNTWTGSSGTIGASFDCYGTGMGNFCVWCLMGMAMPSCCMMSCNTSTNVWSVSCDYSNISWDGCCDPDTVTVTINGGGGGGGEPHFVGLDGVGFDFHGTPGNWYLLWDGCDMRIEAYFDLEAAAARYPTFGGTTFITKLRIRVGGSSWDLDAYKPDGWDGVEALKGGNMERGLPEELQEVEGDVEWAKVIPFRHGRVIATCMSFSGWYDDKEFNFLNVGFDGLTLEPCMSATGILGQTLRPVEQRVVDLEQFRVV